jgi:hypothetical protein
LHVGPTNSSRWGTILENFRPFCNLIGAVLLEQNDEWLLQCRYMQIEGMAELTPPLTQRRNAIPEVARKK